MGIFSMLKKNENGSVPGESKPAAVTTAVDGERSHAEIMVVMGALMLAMLLASLDQTIVSTALPRIAVDLNGLNKFSWVATSYLLASAVATPIYGKLGDMYGRKKIFISSILIFLIGSVLCGLSQTMDQLIIFRAVQGIGGGGLMALVLAIVGEVVPPRQRGRYQGYLGGVFAVSSVAGPLIGGFFTDHLSWHWIFFINVPLGAVALFFIITRLHLPVRRNPHKIMVLGQTDGFRYIGFQRPLTQDEIKKLPIPIMAHKYELPSFTQVTIEDDGSMTIGFDSMNFYEPFVCPDQTPETSLFVQYAQQVAERIGGISLDQTVRFIGPGSMFSEENLEDW